MDMMKYIARLFLIVYLFFVSLSVNAAENLHCDFHSLSVIQVPVTQAPVYLEASNIEKFIVPAAKNSETIIVSAKGYNQNSVFKGFRDKLTPENPQFSLLLSYIYNKSYLHNGYNSINRIVLSEINPNAP